VTVLVRVVAVAVVVVAVPVVVVVAVVVDVHVPHKTGHDVRVNVPRSSLVAQFSARNDLPQIEISVLP
jgi:hypothetical protein